MTFCRVERGLNPINKVFVKNFWENFSKKSGLYSPPFNVVSFLETRPPLYIRPKYRKKIFGKILVFISMKKIIRLTESDLIRIVKTIISENESESPYVKKYIAVITGPEEYLPGGKLIEEFTISEEDIEDYLSEDDGTVEEAIEYFMDEYIAEWEQRWCKVQFYTVEEFEELSKHKPSLGFRRR